MKKVFKITQVRRLALQILQDEQFLRDAFNKNVEYRALQKADRALLMELLYGVTRHRLTLSHIIKKFSDKKNTKLDPLVLNAIQLGLYQILFLDRIPPHASISQSVALVKDAKRTKYAGYVNAILRKISREIKTCQDAWGPDILPVHENLSYKFPMPIFPSPIKDISSYLSYVYSYPRWLVEDWINQFGKERTCELLIHGNQTPPLILRTTCTSIEENQNLVEEYKKFGLSAQTLKTAILVEKAGSVVDIPGFKEGKVFAQGLASMEVAPFLDPKPGEWILDLCAAPGGKSSHMSQLMNGKGGIVACDISWERLVRLKENCDRLKIDNIYPVVLDGCNLPPSFHKRFDRVLLDAPCSNTAVLARRVEARWRVNLDSLKQLSSLQISLLLSAGEAVKPEGTIVYSTCSLQKEENHKVVEEFLKQKPCFHLKEEKQILPLPPGLDGVTMFRISRDKECIS